MAYNAFGQAMEALILEVSDKFEDEEGISIVLWSVIFVILLIVTIWFYITQISPGRASKCEVSEEEREDQVAWRILEHDDEDTRETSKTKRTITYCEPSASSERPTDYEIVDGEIRIHHSSYELEKDTTTGNTVKVDDSNSPGLVRRPSMEDMSLIFPGFLPSILEEEEELEEQEEQEHKLDEKVSVCEFDKVKSSLNKYSVSNGGDSDWDVNTGANYGDVDFDFDDFASKDKEPTDKQMNGVPGRIRNEIGNFPAKTSEIRLRNRKHETVEQKWKSEARCNTSDEPNRSTLADESELGDKEKLFEPRTAVLVAAESINTSEVEERENVIELKSSYINPSKAISGSTGSKGDMSNSIGDIETEKYCEKLGEKTKLWPEWDGNGQNANEENDKSGSKTTGIISAGKPNDYVNKTPKEGLLCFAELNGNIEVAEHERNGSEMEREHIENEVGESTLSQDEGKALTFNKVSSESSSSVESEHNDNQNHRTHSWTFFSMSENDSDLNNAEITPEIPKIIVDSYEDEINMEEKALPKGGVVVKPWFNQPHKQLNSFETDIDVDDIILEDEEGEGECSLFFKRHVSVTDLDKILSQESLLEFDKLARKEIESELVRETDIERIVHDITHRIGVGNDSMYTETNLDEEFEDSVQLYNGLPSEQLETSLGELVEKPNKSLMENEVTKYDNFMSGHVVASTLSQIPDEVTNGHSNGLDLITSSGQDVDVAGKTKEQSETKKKRKSITIKVVTDKVVTEKVTKPLDQASTKSVKIVTQSKPGLNSGACYGEDVNLEIRNNASDNKTPTVLLVEKDEEIIRVKRSGETLAALNAQTKEISIKGFSNGVLEGDISPLKQNIAAGNFSDIDQMERTIAEVIPIVSPERPFVVVKDTAKKSDGSVKTGSMKRIVVADNVSEIAITDAVENKLSACNTIPVEPEVMEARVDTVNSVSLKFSETNANEQVLEVLYQLIDEVNEILRTDASEVEDNEHPAIRTIQAYDSDIIADEEKQEHGCVTVMVEKKDECVTSDESCDVTEEEPAIKDIGLYQSNIVADRERMVNEYDTVEEKEEYSRNSGEGSDFTEEGAFVRDLGTIVCEDSVLHEVAQQRKDERTMPAVMHSDESMAAVVTSLDEPIVPVVAQRGKETVPDVFKVLRDLEQCDERPLPDVTLPNGKALENGQDYFTKLNNKPDHEPAIEVVTQAINEVSPFVTMSDGKYLPTVTQSVKEMDKQEKPKIIAKCPSRSPRSRSPLKKGHVEERNLNPRVEKTVTVKPERGELETLIKIDQIPNYNIGLKICMAGRVPMHISPTAVKKSVTQHIDDVALHKAMAIQSITFTGQTAPYSVTKSVAHSENDTSREVVTRSSITSVDDQAESHNTITKFIPEIVTQDGLDVSRDIECKVDKVVAENDFEMPPKEDRKSGLIKDKKVAAIVKENKIKDEQTGNHLPNFSVGQTKSYNELRSFEMQKEAEDKSAENVAKNTARGVLSFPSSPEPVNQVSDGEGEVPLNESQALQPSSCSDLDGLICGNGAIESSCPDKTFTTRITVDEVIGQKRRITILNVRKRAPGAARWKSLNDLDSMTVQKRVGHFKSIRMFVEEDGSKKLEDEALEEKKESLESVATSLKTEGDLRKRVGSPQREIKETIFAVSGLSPTPISEKDYRIKEEQNLARPSSPFTSTQLRNVIGPRQDLVTSKRGIKGRVFAVKGVSPTPSSELEYQANENELTQRRSLVTSPTIDPLTLDSNRTSGRRGIKRETTFAVKGVSPTPGSDKDNKVRGDGIAEMLSSSFPEEKCRAQSETDNRDVYGINEKGPQLYKPTSREMGERCKTTEGSSEQGYSSFNCPSETRKETIFAISAISPTPLSKKSYRRRREERSFSPKQSSIEQLKEKGSPGDELSAAKRRSDRESTGKTEVHVDGHGNDSSRKGSPCVMGKETIFAISGVCPRPKDEDELQRRPSVEEPSQVLDEAKAPFPNTLRVQAIKVAACETKTENKDLNLKEKIQSTIANGVSSGFNEGLDTRRFFAISGVSPTPITECKYRITEDGWLHKSPLRTSERMESPPEDSSEPVRQSGVMVTDLDAFLSASVSPMVATPAIEMIDDTDTVAEIPYRGSDGQVITNEGQSTGLRTVVRESQATSVVTTTKCRVVNTRETRVLDRNGSLIKGRNGEPIGARNPACTIPTSMEVQETDLDAIFGNEDLAGEVSREDTLEEQKETLVLTRVDHVNKRTVNGTQDDRVNQQPIFTAPVVVEVAADSQQEPVIRAFPINDGLEDDELDDVFIRVPNSGGLYVNNENGSMTYSSDADSETSSVTSVPLKPKARHTRASLEAVKASLRPLRLSQSSSDSSSITPVPSERSESDFEPFVPIERSTSTPVDESHWLTHEGSVVRSRKTATESGHYIVKQVTAEGSDMLIDSRHGAPQSKVRAVSESQLDTSEFRGSAFTPVRARYTGRRPKSHVFSGKIHSDEEKAVKAVIFDGELEENLEGNSKSFKEMSENHKSMPDLHKVRKNEDEDNKSSRVPYHARLSAHTRLWLSQTAGIDTSDLCKDESIGSEIFLYPSNRFQPGKSVDASFLSIISDSESPDDVSTRPSSPMSEFSFAGETPFVAGRTRGGRAVVICGNPHCGQEDVVLGNEKTSFTSCPSCFTYYCTRECRRAHWREHKKVCYFGRINSYIRSFVYFSHKKENLKLLLSKIATTNFQKKGRGCVMITFASPQSARKFMTSGCVLLPSPPSYSTISDLRQEGVVSKHKVALLQILKDYDPGEEFVMNLAIVAGKTKDLPTQPVPRHSSNTVLQCVKIPLSDAIMEKQPANPIPDTSNETKVFYLPKCARHEFVNEMEARRHYCRNISKGLKQYDIRLKNDYPEIYDKLCLYVERSIPFEPLTVYGNKGSKIVTCKIMPEGDASEMEVSKR